MGSEPHRGGHVLTRGGEGTTLAPLALTLSLQPLPVKVGRPHHSSSGGRGPQGVRPLPLVSGWGWVRGRSRTGSRGKRKSRSNDICPPAGAPAPACLQEVGGTAGWCGGTSGGLPRVGLVLEVGVVEAGAVGLDLSTASWGRP